MYIYIYIFISTYSLGIETETQAFSGVARTDSYRPRLGDTTALEIVEQLLLVLSFLSTTTTTTTTTLRRLSRQLQGASAAESGGRSQNVLETAPSKKN